MKARTKKRTVSSAKAATWKVFSLWVRMRDCLETTGCTSWGLCVTCGKRYHIKLLQAGHFISGRHNANLFSERGTHAQCYNCNINLRGNTLPYRRRIIELYGVGADEELERAERELLKFTVQGLDDLRRHYENEIAKLEGK